MKSKGYQAVVVDQKGRKRLLCRDEMGYKEVDALSVDCSEYQKTIFTDSEKKAFEYLYKYNSYMQSFDWVECEETSPEASYQDLTINERIIRMINEANEKG